MLASYNPQYWVYETERVHKTVSVEVGGDPEILTFKNTDTILILTQTPGLYDIKYSVVKETPIPLNPDEFFYSQYITLACGFTLMGIALVAFEGKTFMNFVLRKIKKKSNTQQEHIQIENQDSDNSLGSNDDFGDGMGGSIVADDNPENTGFG